MSTFEINAETLMAYADGELDAEQAARVEQHLRVDPAAAAQVAQHRALREQLRSGFAGTLSEPVPERLLALLQPAASTQVVADKSNEKVVDLAHARQRKNKDSRRWSKRQWGAVAASLVVGIVVGMYSLNFNAGNLISASNGVLVAQGKLDSALNTQLASAAGAASAVQIGVSFRNHEGNYCRSFTVRNEQALAGLACRDQNQWRVQMLTEAAATANGEFRQAASVAPAAVLSLIDAQIAGEPMDADAEITAREAGWK